MLFNRINHLFDQLNITLDAETVHKWKNFELNGSSYDNYSLANMISETLNMSEFFPDDGGFNITQMPENGTVKSAHFAPEPLSVLVLVTICYLFIFIAGVLGNVITCTVISRNKSMHTATNYYLFNLAISDLLLLLSGMPQDTYNIWFPNNYRFTQTICILQGLLSETSTNATVLTIASFTIERYIAICHPFRQHTMSKLSRAIKFIMGIWFVAFCLAIPQAIQFGVVQINGGQSCTVQNILVEHAFEVSSFLFFVGPMTLICVLYVLIGVKLRKSKLLQGVKRRGCEFGRGMSGQTRVIRMLIAVAVAFFLCWAPFHAQRLMAVYGKTAKPKSNLFRRIYTVLTYVSGVLYFMSTCINPLLYSIMSHKFRDAFKLTIAKHCGLGTEYVKRNHTYSALSRCNGMGSFKMTVAAANNQRTTPYTNEPNRKFSIAGSRNGNMDSTFIALQQGDGTNLPKIFENDSNNCLSGGSRDDDRYRQRFVSVGSQSTLLATISKVDGNGVITKTGDCGINNNIDGTILPAKCVLNKIATGDNGATDSDSNFNVNDKQRTHQQSQSTLGTIAEKLRRKVGLFKSPSQSSAPSAGSENGKRDGRKLEKDNSVDSAHTNTISNSSLQEVDDDEFESTELAKYMGQINSEIR